MLTPLLRRVTFSYLDFTLARWNMLDTQGNRGLKSQSGGVVSKELYAAFAVIEGTAPNCRIMPKAS